jgi:glutamyl-tRNA reductase
MYVVSANFKRTPWATLSQLAEAVEAVDQLVHAERNFPVVSVATCNRVEWYGDSTDEVDSQQLVIAALTTVLGQPLAQISQQFFVAEGVDAIEHLHRVTAGLEAIARGESEVGGQVRRAYTNAIQANRVSPRLRRMFDDALRVNRDLRRLEPHQDTNLVSLAMDLVVDASVLKKLLVIGTGEFARTVHERMHQFGVHEQWNFSTSGRRIALAFPTHRVDSVNLLEVLAEVDVVIAASGAVAPVVTADMIDVLHREGRSTPILIDLALTQDIEYAIDEMQPVIRLEQLARSVTGTASDQDDKYVRMRAEMLAHRMNVPEAERAS